MTGIEEPLTPEQEAYRDRLVGEFLRAHRDANGPTDTERLEAVAENSWSILNPNVSDAGPLWSVWQDFHREDGESCCWYGETFREAIDKAMAGRTGGGR